MARLTRRAWLAGVGAGALWLGSGCATSRAAHVPQADGARPAAAPMPIVEIPHDQPDPTSVLRQPAESAADLGAAGLRELDERMRATLAKSGGVGLAAPQVGISRRVVLVELERKPLEVVTCIDPRFASTSSGRVPGWEACLSIPGVGGRVERACSVDVAYLDLAGRPRRSRASGWVARIFQHELDHLDGVLYIDKLAGELVSIDRMRTARVEERKQLQAEGQEPYRCYADRQ